MNADLGKTAFTPAEIDDLRDRLKALKDGKGHSWQELGRITGVPSGTLSGWVPGTYNGGKIHETHDIAARIHRFFLSLEEKEALEAVMPSAPDFQRTPSSVRMMTVLAMAQLGDMVAIATPPGCGKTAAIDQYVATRAQVYKATASPTISTVPAMLFAILEAMGERDATRTAYSLTARVRRRVQGSGALIIIDEAQELSRAALNEIRAIHDATGCGIALVGDETLNVNLRNFPQLYSRLGVRHSQTRPTNEDVAVIAEGWGITKGAELAYLQALARKGGGIRTLTKTLQLAVRSARANGAPLDISDIKDAVAQRYGDAA